jgi:hypothetical protein
MIHPPRKDMGRSASPWRAKSRWVRDHFRLFGQDAINVITRMAAMNGI